MTAHSSAGWMRRAGMPAVAAALLGAISWCSRAPAASPPVADQAAITDSAPLDIVEGPAERGPRVPGQFNVNPGVEIEDALQADPTSERVSIFVHLDPDLPRDSVPRSRVKEFAAQQGGMVKYEYKVAMPNVLNLRNVARGDLDAIRQLPGVQRVELDEYYDNVLMLHDSVALINGLQSQINSAGLSADGSGVRVCIVDTGIDTDHIMYSDRIDLAASFDFHNGDSNPQDDNGHGSHVAGIVGGGTGLVVDFGCVGPEPFQGVAPEATLISAKVLNAFGGGLSSNIIAGIDHCADQSPSGGRADVINMSIGTGQFTGNCTHSWAVAANNAVAAGVVAVAASGNENFSNAMSSPACGVNVIAVGATYDDSFPSCEDPTGTWNWGVCVDNNPPVDKVVCFSNESDFLDVAAPGCNIFSASTASGGGSIAAQCGTSMASPHVAGLAALLLDVDPTLSPAEVRQLIRDGAVDLGPAGFDRGYGHGRIDVVDTLELLGGGDCTSSGECDDGLFCNGTETCVANTCQPGTPVNCSDGVSCTVDSCNESTDSCNNVPNNAACSDGLFCNGSETCSATLGCQAGSDPCPGEECNESTDTCFTPGGGQVWVSFTGNTSVPGVGTVANEDIVAYDLGSGAWSLIFDGSDVGLSGLAINGMEVLGNGDILLSFTAAGTVPGLSGGPSGSSVDDSDVVRFIPATLGSSTSGSFLFQFDGSDVGLTSSSENIDAIGVSLDGRLVLSVTGNFSGTGASGVDEDLMIFTASAFGSVTSGSFAMYFDGSDVGLSNSSNEDTDGASFSSSGSLLLSTLGAFSVPGLSGSDEDVFEFFPSQLGSTTSGSYAALLDLSTLGISTGANVAAVSIVE